MINQEAVKVSDLRESGICQQGATFLKNPSVSCVSFHQLFETETKL